MSTWDSTATQQTLQAHVPGKPLLIGMDNDGCVFDSMRIKMEQHFIPLLLTTFGLKEVEKDAYELAHHICLRSPHRGANRYRWLSVFLQQAVQTFPHQAAQWPAIAPLLAWLDTESKPSILTLANCLAQGQDTVGILHLVHHWSQQVDSAVAEHVHSLPPFAHAEEALRKLGAIADIVVISTTPTEAVRREWQSSGIGDLPRLICGQEFGPKTPILQHLLASGYQHGCMFGDAPGDRQAAQANAIDFMPIIPGQEGQSWASFLQEGLPALQTSGRLPTHFMHKHSRAFDHALQLN